MKKNSIFFVFFAFMFILIQPLFSSEIIGVQACNSIYSAFVKAGFHVEKRLILNNSESTFPFNMEIVFPKNSAIGRNSDEVDNFILAFTVEDTVNNQDFFIKLLNKIKKSEHSYKITALFTYGDNPPISDAKILRGTDVYLQQFDDTDYTTALCIKLSKRYNGIVPGGSAQESPSWLVKLCADSFLHAGINYRIKGGMLTFLFRMNILKSDFRTENFLKNNIPSATLILALPETAAKENYLAQLDFFSVITEWFNFYKTKKHSNIALILKFGKKTFFVSERFTIVTAILGLAVILFILCQISFKNKDMMGQIIKLWYLLPLSLVITTFSLSAGSFLGFIIQKLFHIDVYIKIFIKISTAFILVFLTYIATFHKKTKFSTKTYSYFLHVAATINIFVFLSLDISLFYFAFLEYLLSIASKHLKRTFSSVIGFIMLLAPFVFYTVQLLLYTDTETLDNLFSKNFIADLFMAFGLIPFEFIWLRLFTRLNKIWNFTKLAERKKIIKSTIAVCANLFTICFIIFAVNKFIPQKYKYSNFNAENISVIEDDTKNININYKDFTIFSDTTREIAITNFLNTEICSIKISSKNSSPILYSDEIYELDTDKKTCYILLPLNPPENVKFRYIANTKEISTITVESWHKTKETDKNGKTVYSKTAKTIEIPAISGAS